MSSRYEKLEDVKKRNRMDEERIGGRVGKIEGND
jgi:hypothetical protein